MSNRIPFVDLKAQYRDIRSELDAAIQGTIDASAFILGERAKAFEQAFAEYCGAGFGVGCSSGTTALHLALMGCGVGPGDEVITVSHTFIATAEPICHCGATPVFVDVDPETYTMDPSKIEAAITKKTKAILPVHLYGQCADMTPILKIAADAGLKVIEDAAQAHGADYKGRRAGSMGDFGTFSFFPGKNLGAYGDAGMLMARDADSADRLRMMRNHGRTSKFEHEFIGYNYRLDTLQAAILQVKLRHLDEWIQARRRIAHRYSALLADAPVQTPVEVFGHVYHLYVIQCDDRDALAASLADRGVATGMHYPVPVHLQPCFSELPTAGRGRLPVTEALVGRILSLPMYPELTEEMQGTVVDSVLSGLAG